MFVVCETCHSLCYHQFVSITYALLMMMMRQYIIIETCPCSWIADQLEFKSVYKHKYHETTNDGEKHCIVNNEI